MIDWVHPICILWNAYLRYSDFSKKNSLVGDAQGFRKYAHKDRQCAYCNDSTYKGFKIDCELKDCSACFHVTCAAKKGIIYECDLMVADGLRDLATVATFCPQHKAKGV